MDIEVWNRRKNALEIEHVYGEWALQGVYGTKAGQVLADHVFSKSIISQLYGVFQSSKMSAAKVAPFVKKFKIPMDEFEHGPFDSFNDFFIRKFKPGMRPFEPSKDRMGAFCEARYYAYESLASDQQIPIKGGRLSLKGLLGLNGEGSIRQMDQSSESTQSSLDSSKRSELERSASDEPSAHLANRAHLFEGGPVLLARLCPVDYHRFHFPDEGKLIDQYTVGGRLHSVNPLALDYNRSILVTNERQVSLLETKNFGLLAYVEVGAICVGKIVQTHSGESFNRGDEKGYFLFGGSTVVVLGQKGKWVPDQDLLDRTQAETETLVELGSALARRV